MEANRIYATVCLDRQGNVVEVRDKDGKVREPKEAKSKAALREGDTLPSGKKAKYVVPLHIELITTTEHDEDPCVVCVNGRCYCVCPPEFC